MTTMTSNDPHLSVRRPAPQPPKPGADRSRARVLSGVVVIVAFVVSLVLQNVTLSRHRQLVANTGSEANVSNLNSSSLALLLGGLRGPLVMMLWTSSESQKQEKDLEDFDSKIELIRLLQPEFDSVHIFQMWNKAYNISVQMANKANKYATIVDALEYGYKINQQHPNDINIVSQIGQLFFDKLGSSQEQHYYIDRVCRESFPDVRVTLPANAIPTLEAALAKTNIEPARRLTLVQQAQRNGSIVIDKLSADIVQSTLNGPGVKYEEARTQAFNENGRRVRLDPILDLNGRLTVAAAGDPGINPDSLNAPILAWLRKFEPFPTGVSPLAIGNAYYKRSQILKDELHQKHLQLSDLVVDNRPAISTKNWAENEWGAGRRAEMAALGKEIPASNNYAEERERTELPTAVVPPTAPVTNPDAAREAIAHYDLVTRIAKISLQEFQRHARNYPAAIGQFRGYRQQIDAMVAICQADHDYLAAMILPPGDTGRTALLESAAKLYRTAMLDYEAESLEHDMPDSLVLPKLPPGVSLEEFADRIHQHAAAAPPKSLTPLDQTIMGLGLYLDSHKNEDVHQSERIEAQRYISRTYQRLTQLNAAPK
jgi:hypothetical protein